MKIKTKWLVFSLIMLLAVALRFYQLGNIPHGLAWDEAAIGYNGYAIVVSRRDEWLSKLPITFRSFGDYKAPLAIYIVGPLVKLFGSHNLAIRFPFAVAGVLTVAAWWWLGELIYTSNKKSSNLTANIKLTLLAVSVLTVATSPWHIHYSRVAFESGLALFLLVAGILSFCFALLKQSSYKLWFYILAGASLVASLYAYHSSKIVVPILGLGILVIWWPIWKKDWQKLGIAVLVSACLLWPLAHESIFGLAGTRFEQASVFGLHLSISDTMATIISNFTQHFTPRFLLFGYTDTLRHGSGTWGVLLPTTFVVALAGLLFGRKNGWNKWWYLAIIWLLAGLLPAAIGREAPQSNRALLAIPSIWLFVFLGWQAIYAWVSKHPWQKKQLGSHGETGMLWPVIIGTWLILHLAFVLAANHHYFTVYAKQSASHFLDGYLDSMRLAAKYEKGLDEYPQVEEIVFTNHYQQAYIYALLVRRTNPIWYQGGSLNTFVFRAAKPSDLLPNEKTRLVVTEPTDWLPEAAPTHTILGSDDQPRFYIYFVPKVEIMN